jgi:hypothetical protein
MITITTTKEQRTMNDIEDVQSLRRRRQETLMTDP